MSKQIKIVISIGVIGIVLLIAGFVMGSRPSSLPAVFSEENLPDGAIDVSQVSSDTIQNVILNLAYSDISIKTGENFSFSGTGLYDSYVQDNTYYVGYGDTKHTAKALGMSFSVPSKLVCGYGSYVLVLPQDGITDRQIQINTKGCDITCDSLIAGQLDITMKGGDLTIEDLSASTASINVTKGNVVIGASKITETGNITAKKSISIGNGDVLGSNVVNNLTLSNTRGGITFYGKVTGTSSFTAKHNNIDVYLSGTAANYSLTGMQERTTVNSTGDSSEEAESEIFGTLDLEPHSGNATVTY